MEVVGAGHGAHLGAREAALPLLRQRVVDQTLGRPHERHRHARRMQTLERRPESGERRRIALFGDRSAVEVGEVVRVIDGDSIEVRLDGEDIQVRYIGINTPEYYSDERDEAIIATQANKDLVQGKTIYMFKDQSNKDRYDRLLRYVLTDKDFVNLEQVRNGYAEAKEYPPDTACHKVFEEAAK